MESPKEKIDDIVERLGMSGLKAAMMMNISYDRYRKNTSGNDAYKFSEKNYTDLFDYVITEMKSIISSRKENEIKIKMKSLEDVVVTYNDILLNYKKYNKQDDWNLFDALKKVVDNMETLQDFEDNELYDKVITDIIVLSALIRDPNTFTIERYKDYVSKDKVNDHQRWHSYIIRRRKITINDILNS